MTKMDVKMTIFLYEHQYLILLLTAFVLIMIYVALRQPEEDKNMTEEQRIEYLGTQKALDESRKAAFDVKSEGGYSQMTVAKYQSKINADGMQLCNYIINKFNSKLTTIINVLNSLKTQIQTNLQTNLNDLTPESINLKIRTQVIQDQAEIRRIFQKKQESDMNFMVFRGKYEITKPCSETLKESALVVLGFFVIFESLVNLWFYRASFGAIQSWIISIGVSLINISVGYFFGTLFRYKNLPDRSYRGWLSLGGAVIATIVFMGFISWFRLNQDNIEITRSALIFDSTILFIFGIFGAAIAFKYGYESDDSIPGYGDVCRHKKSIDDEYNAIKTAASSKLVGLFEKYDREFLELKHKTKQNLDVFQQNINDATHTDSTWISEYEALENKLNSLNRSFCGTFGGLLLNEPQPDFIQYKLELPSLEPAHEKKNMIDEFKRDYEKFSADSSIFLDTINVAHVKYNEYRQQVQASILEEILAEQV